MKYKLFCIHIFLFFTSLISAFCLDGCQLYNNDNNAVVQKNSNGNKIISKFPQLSYRLTGDSMVLNNNSFIRIYLVPCWPKPMTNVLSMTIELSEDDSLQQFRVLMDTGAILYSTIKLDTLIDLNKHNTSLLQLINVSKKVPNWEYPIDIYDPFFTYMEWVDEEYVQGSTSRPNLTNHLKGFVSEREILNSEILESLLLEIDTYCQTYFNFSIFALMELT